MELKRNSGFLFLLDLLRIRDIADRIRAWEIALRLAEKGVLDYEVLSRMKYYFLEILQTSTEASSPETKELARKLIEKGILREEETRYLIGLLMLDSFILQHNGWEYLKLFLKKGMVDSRMKSLFLRVFRSNQDDIFLSFVIDDLEGGMDKGLLKKSDVFSIRQSLKALLMDDNFRTRHRGWSEASIMLRCGALSMKEIRNLLPFYMDMRIRFNDEIFSDDWDECSLRSLLGSGILSRNERDFFIGCLGSANIGIRKYVWYSIKELVEGGILDIGEVSVMRDKFMSLLENYHFSELYEQWKSILYLVERGIITRENRDAFLSMLNNEDERIGTHAWMNVLSLISHGIIERSEVKEKMQFFLDLLTKPHYGFLDDLWQLVPKYIGEGVLDSSHGSSFLNILKHPDFRIRRYAWDNSGLLMREGVLSKEDVDDLPQSLRDRGNLLEVELKEFSEGPVKIRVIGWDDSDGGLGDVKTLPDLVEKLSEPFLSVRENAWRTTKEFIEQGRINQEHKYLILDLFADREESVRLNAWEEAEYLVDKGILTWKDLEEFPLHLRIDPSELYGWYSMHSESYHPTRKRREEMMKEICNPSKCYDVNLQFSILNLLMDDGKLDSRDASRFIRFLVSSRKNDDNIPWLLAVRLIGLLEIDRNSKEALLSLMKSRNNGKANRGWTMLKLLLAHRVVKMEDSQFFLSLLSGRRSVIRMRGWAEAGDLLDHKVLNRKSLREIRSRFLSIFRNEKYGRRKYAWEHLQTLVESGIVGKEDSGFFISLLKGMGEDSMDCWYNAWRLTDLGILSHEEIRPLEAYFFRSLEADRSDDIYAWKVFANLVVEGIISKTDFVKYSGKFINLLRSRNMSRRLSAWELSWMMVNLGIIERNDLMKVKDKFLGILHCNDKYATRNAAFSIPVLTDLGIMSETEAENLIKESKKV